jgi:hypothetical protein
MNTYPYTYRITSKTTGQHYYGVRYRKGCNPSDFWVDYFTSSKRVHALIEQYGKDDFTTQIRHTFPNGKDAIAWEAKVLSKLNVTNRDDWLNDAIFPPSGNPSINKSNHIPKPIDAFESWLEAFNKETEKNSKIQSWYYS